MTDNTQRPDDSRTDTPTTAAEERSASDPTPSAAEPDTPRVTPRRVLNALGLVVLIAVVAPFVVYAVPGVVGADASFVVLSGSMEPAISAGDVVIVESMAPAAISVDDVITYSRSDQGATVTHRVIDIDGEGAERVFYTKGDANEAPDQRSVPASTVVGAVVLTLPYLGYVIQFVGTTTGFVLLVVLPFAALVLSEAVGYLRKRRGDDEPAADSPAESVADSAAEPASHAAPVVDVATAAPHPPRLYSGSTLPALPSASTPTTAPAEPAPASTAPAPASAPPETDGMAFSSTDVLLTLAVLTVAFPYAAYVAIQQETALSIGAAVGFGMAFALLAGLFLFARLTERGDSAVEQGTPATPAAASDGGTTIEEEP